MIFLPNKYERFCATLRNRIQKHCFTMPLSPKKREILRKIYFAEAIFKVIEPIPIDIKNYAVNLLGAVQIIKICREERFVFRVETRSKYLMDKKVLETLLLTLAEDAHYIGVIERDFRLIITVNIAPDTKIKRLLKKINSYWFYELKTNQTIMVISADITSKPDSAVKYESELLTDPVSSVNVFIKKSAP